MNKRIVVHILAVAASIALLVTGIRSLRAMEYGDSELITIQTQDLKELLVPVEFVKLSKTLTNLVEDAGSENPLPLPNISAEVWQLVEHNLADIALIARNTDIKKARTRVAQHLKSLSGSNLIKLIATANYLDILELLSLASNVAGEIDPNQIEAKELLSLPKEIRNPIILTQVNKVAGPLNLNTNQVLQGHSDQVSSVCVTPDGTKIVSGSQDDTVRIWNIQSIKELAALRGHTESVSSVCITPDGGKIVSGSYDITVRIWDIQAAKELTVLRSHEGIVFSVCVTPDGSKIVSGSGDNTVRIRDIQSGKELAVLRGHTDQVRSVCVTPDGKKIVSGSADDTVRIWDIQSGKQLSVLLGHTNSVNSACVTPDGKKIVSGSNDSTVRIWDVQTAKELAVLRGHTELVSSVCVTPDGTKIVSGSFDSTVRIWDIQSAKELAVLHGHTRPVTAVCVTPNGSKIVSSVFGSVRIWDITLLSKWIYTLCQEQFFALWSAIQKKDVPAIEQIRNDIITSNSQNSTCTIS